MYDERDEKNEEIYKEQIEEKTEAETVMMEVVKEFIDHEKLKLN